MIPHFFKKEPIPAITNEELDMVVRLVSKQKTKQQALVKAYEIITAKYKGFRFRTLLYLPKAWETDPNLLWKRRGFMHCTQQNYLLRLLLIKSGWFNEEDIQHGYSLIWFVSPHQYLKIKVDDDWIDVDVWNKAYGTSIGQHGGKALPFLPHNYSIR